MTVVNRTKVASAHILLVNHDEFEMKLKQCIEAIIYTNYTGPRRWHRMAVVGACGNRDIVGVIDG
jgi:hypothetical protein